MGIPSYFSQLVKNYTKTFSKVKPSVVHNLYLDSNSIVYDAYHSIVKDNGGNTSSANKDVIVSRVIHQIETYIADLHPTQNVFIAFDGVPPMAKVRQQRARRLKGQFEKQMKRQIIDSYRASSTSTSPSAVSVAVSSTLLAGANNSDWDPIVITPGTDFMKYMNDRIRCHFRPPTSPSSHTPMSASSLSPRILFSGSDEVGEGEHKLFEYIRQHPEEHRHHTTVVYGLDADLIMLCLFHLDHCDNLFLYREAPHFAMSSLEPDAGYFLDIPELANAIAIEMSFGTTPNEIRQATADYVLLCFFLGNDFMPHTPTLNIRNGGIDTLLKAYRACSAATEASSTCSVSAPSFHLVSTAHTAPDGSTSADTTSAFSIQWHNVHMLLSTIASQETELMRAEHSHRAHLNRICTQRRNQRIDTLIANNTTSNAELELKELFQQLNDQPISQRDTEHRIAPQRPHWNRRYYQELMFVDEQELCVGTKGRDRDARRTPAPIVADISSIVRDYLQCIEWTFHYYTHKCIDWRWYYPYMYAPLVQDVATYLASALPSQQSFFRCTEHANKPLQEHTLLMYVFPPSAWNQLPTTVRESANRTGQKWLQRHHSCGCGQQFMWAYCRYFWESHPVTPPIFTRRQLLQNGDI